MIAYLMKSAGCLLVFYLFYRLVLEKESMHLLKRFYLLIALVLAHLIPLITFTRFVQDIPDAAWLIPGSPTGAGTLNTPELATLESTLPPLLPVAIYMLGLMVLALRFGQNIMVLVRRIRTNHKVKTGSLTRVLLREMVVPHTFLTYIFLNKNQYESRLIPDEVILHEETHARQRHSLDILLIELLQVLFWFNPLIYLFKKSIALNHEFLADQKVLAQGVTPATYFGTLLAYSNPGQQRIQRPGLSHAINYSSIKKRFTVMKTNTPKKVRWIKSLLLVPLAALLLLSFSSTEIQYEPPQDTSRVEPTKHPVITLEIKNDLSLWLNDSQVVVEELAEKMLELVSPKIIGGPIQISAPEAMDIPANLLGQLKSELGKLGIRAIAFHTGGPVPNIFESDKIPVMADHPPGEGGVTGQEMSTYTRLINTYKSPLGTTGTIPSKDLKILEKIYQNMSPLQKAHSDPYLQFVHTKSAQDSATPEMVSEYNSLARKYNAMRPDSYQIIGREVKRMQYLYNAMSLEQKKAAEPFPQFPDPPIPPQPVVSSPGIREDIAVQAPVNKKVARDVPIEQPTAVVKEEKKQVKAQVLPNRDVPQPPPPPPPVPQEEFIEEMAAKNAIFYHEGQKIPAEKALSLVRGSKPINVRARHTGLAQPVVELTAGELVIKSEP